jgi:mRNA interferase MazF
MDYPVRGEIWIVSIEPILGHEIGKTRPALVISNDRNNEFASTITIIPITSNIEKIYPFEVSISKLDSGLSSDSKMKCNQIRTIDKLRLIKKISMLGDKYLKKIEIAVLIHLGIKNSEY